MTVFGRVQNLFKKAPDYIQKYGPEVSKLFRNPLFKLALGSRSDVIADYIDKFTRKAPSIIKSIY